jgi:dimethylhistidine N-methyltransferase
MRPANAGVHAIGRSADAQFAADVRYYVSLNPPQLPSQYFYDDLGSALFEAICRLPWYGITRAELRLLAAHRDEVFRRLPPISSVVELGPGSGEKLRVLLEAGEARARALDVHLVDLSQSALEIAAHTVGAVSAAKVTTHHATYEAGLRAATSPGNGHTLVAFLGSNIGNFDPPGTAAFLQNLRAGLAIGDAVLLGIDLVKPEPALLLAYDDPLGVTAAFNLNLLERINRELDGNFRIDKFAHRARWNEDRSRMEMHLVARSPQQIHIGRANVDLALAAGEHIWTESSYKYRPAEIVDLLHSCGLHMTAQWVDVQDAFALTLARAV